MKTFRTEQDKPTIYKMSSTVNKNLKKVSVTKVQIFFSNFPKEHVNNRQEISMQQ